MGNFNWQYLIDGAAALYGLYVLMSAIKMKLTGEISSFVASPEELHKCEDKREFIKTTGNPMICFGLSTLLYGASNVANSFIWNNVIYNISSLSIFLLSCVLFILFLNKVRKKYLNL